MTLPAADEDYDDEDTTQRGATAYAGTGSGINAGPVGAGGGPTIRAVTLGALSVPVPKHVEIRRVEAPPKTFPWAAVLISAAAGAVVALVAGALALHLLGFLRLF